MENNYHGGWNDGWTIMLGTAVKYASLLKGVYSVFKDEPDFTVATFVGLTYLCGESLKRVGESNITHKNFSLLEKNSKGKIKSFGSYLLA